MSVLRCEMCGGTLVTEENGKFAVCEYCGTRKSIATVSEPSAPTQASGGEVSSDAVRLENERRLAEEAKLRREEARVRAEENRVKAESQMLERERLAEKKRIEKKARNKSLLGKILKIFLIITAVIAAGVLTVTVIIPSVRYSGAIKDVEKGNYEEAYETFKSLRLFKDSKSRAEDIIRNHPEVAQVGDIIFYGKYEQDNSTSNGKEEVEWRVVDKDENGGILVVSRYALDCRSYHDSAEQVTWETSEIRSWLNSDFYSSAFSKEERAAVKTVTLENPDNSDYKTDGGNSTKDKIFLLSIDEVKRYFPSTVERICIATKYAEAQGTDIDSITHYCRWWLRSPGSTLYAASFVKVDGFILQLGAAASLEKRSVRPAMWLEF